MAELIKQILALPRSAQLKLISVIASHLQEAESVELDELESWQIDKAKKALDAYESGQVKALESDDFWTQIDQKVEALEAEKGK